MLCFAVFYKTVFCSKYIIAIVTRYFIIISQMCSPKTRMSSAGYSQLDVKKISLETFLNIFHQLDLLLKKIDCLNIFRIFYYKSIKFLLQTFKLILNTSGFRRLRFFFQAILVMLLRRVTISNLISLL
jgi:hypothetical protein